MRMHFIAEEEGCLDKWYIGNPPPPPPLRNKEAVGRGGVIGNWNGNLKQFACAEIGALRPLPCLLIARDSRNGGCGARWCEIGAFWGAMSTHSALWGEIPVRGGGGGLRLEPVTVWNSY
jgi:hypothetical protein